MLEILDIAGGLRAVALGALRELRVPVRFHVQMKAHVCGPIASLHQVPAEFWA